MTAWKALELRVAKALGGTRSGPLGKHSSDINGIPYSAEVKRTTRYQLRQAWITQARRQGKQEHKPWLLIIAEHGDRNPIAVVDFSWLVQVLNERQEQP